MRLRLNFKIGYRINADSKLALMEKPSKAVPKKFESIFTIFVVWNSFVGSRIRARDRFYFHFFRAIRRTVDCSAHDDVESIGRQELKRRYCDGISIVVKPSFETSQ